MVRKDAAPPVGLREPERSKDGLMVLSKQETPLVVSHRYESHAKKSNIKEIFEHGLVVMDRNRLVTAIVGARVGLPAPTFDNFIVRGPVDAARPILLDMTIIGTTAVTPHRVNKAAKRSSELARTHHKGEDSPSTPLTLCCSSNG
jgi:hypothetical protein